MSAPSTAPGAPPAAQPVPLTPEQQQTLAEMRDIRDIAPPVPYGWDLRWVWGAAALLVAAVALWLAWRRLRRGRGSAAEPEVPPAPPDTIALAELEALGREPSLPDKAFYFRLSELLRRYLDGRFGLYTLERTTEELLPVLRTLPLDEAQRGPLGRLLRDADPIKYADAAAAPERRRADLAEAEAFVRATAPAPGEGG